MKPVKEYAINYNLHDLALAAFRGGEAEQLEYEEASRKHEKLYTGLFNQVMSGTIDAFEIFTTGDAWNGSQRIYHRSPKQAGYMQISYIWYHDGELLPTMDAQVQTATDMIKEAAPDNVTIKLYKNRRLKAA